MSLEADFAEIVRRVIREELQAVLKEDCLPHPVAHEEYLSAERAAEIASVGAPAIRKWVRERKLPGCHAGRMLRIRRSDLEEFLRRGPEASAVAPADVADRILARARLKSA